VPPGLAARLRPDALDLPDTDWFVPQLYDFFRDLGASIIRATHTRYVVDLNRPPDATRTRFSPGYPLYSMDDCLISMWVRPAANTELVDAIACHSALSNQ